MTKLNRKSTKTKNTTKNKTPTKIDNTKIDTTKTDNIVDISLQKLELVYTNKYYN